ncbi:MAG: hypothetical protein JXA11_06440 [Phycisphaerae bacterium]|nr:hypothetical protein [Phycisphaerae bacterium]
MTEKPCKFRLDDGQIEVIDDDLAEVMRNKTVYERIAMIGECNETMRFLMAAHLREKHPDWTQKQIEAEIARRMIDDAA